MAQSRRDFFAAAGTTALAGIAAASFARPDALAATGPDAAVLAAAAELVELQDRIEMHSALPAAKARFGSPALIAHEAECSRLIDAMDRPIATLINRRVTTLAGMQARAAAFLRYAGAELDENADEGCLDQQLLRAVVRDLTTIARA